jgi:hypothetical protein
VCVRGVGQSNGNTTDIVHIFINVVFGQLLPSTQPQSFSEWVLTSVKQSLAEFYTILLEKHSCFSDAGGGICSSF